MSRVPTLPEAQALLEQYNEEPFHRRHGQIVSGVLGYFAREYDPEQNYQMLMEAYREIL